ncbi:hypothetical protein [Streptosporangium sp. CA-115845]|uniref:hypothetical protein n=1 Tax=Streptosporangium sp. CA-115845 TaxID=3240071 RepID=UPI003D92450B
MSPVDGRPWWDDLPVVQKVVVFIAPPLFFAIGVAGLVVSRPSGIKLAGIVAFILLSVWLAIGMVRDVLRKRNPKTSEPPLFERAVRGYSRKDVDNYVALVRQLNDTTKRRRALAAPAFGVTLGGYNRHQVHAYLESIKADCSGPYGRKI